MPTKHSFPRRVLWQAVVAISALAASAANLLTGVDSSDRLVQLGLLDVTKAPYLADHPELVKAMQKRLTEAHVTHRGKIMPPDWLSGSKKQQGK